MQGHLFSYCNQAGLIIDWNDGNVLQARISTTTVLPWPEHLTLHATIPVPCAPPQPATDVPTFICHSASGRTIFTLPAPPPTPFFSLQATPSHVDLLQGSSAEYPYTGASVMLPLLPENNYTAEVMIFGETSDPPDTATWVPCLNRWQQQ
jgi:hypothetical protein